MKTSLISTVVIGDFRRSEFHPIIRSIREKTATICFDNLALFRKTHGLGQNFDLIFLLASSFLQYSQRDLGHLRDSQPLARIILVAGSLTEGERRTGWLPSEVIHYYWHQWETEVLPVLAAFCEHRLSPLGLPLTASEEERLLVTTTSMVNMKSTPDKSLQTAVIVADDPAMRELLSDWVAQQGFATRSFRQRDIEAEHGMDMPNEVFFDVASENFAETIATVQLLKTYQTPQARLTVFYNSPRPDETQRLAQAGADRIIAKPFFLPW